MIIAVLIVIVAIVIFEEIKDKEIEKLKVKDSDREKVLSFLCLFDF